MPQMLQHPGLDQMCFLRGFQIQLQEPSLLAPRSVLAGSGSKELEANIEHRHPDPGHRPLCRCLPHLSTPYSHTLCRPSRKCPRPPPPGHPNAQCCWARSIPCQLDATNTGSEGMWGGGWRITLPTLSWPFLACRKAMQHSGITTSP